MKNGTTRMACKAEHAVDLDSDIVVSATVYPGIAADTATIIDTAVDAAKILKRAGSERETEKIVADKGYHSTRVVVLADDLGLRTYIPEQRRVTTRHWVGKSVVMRMLYGIGTPRAFQGFNALARLPCIHTERLVVLLDATTAGLKNLVSRWSSAVAA